MKKFLALSLALAMSLSLAACGGNGGGSSSGSGSGSTSGSGSAADGAQKIGISMPTQSLERWNRDGSYLDQQFQAAGYETEIVSGITSFCAVAARLNTGLVEKAEPLHVIPASYQIEEALKLSGTKVLMKAGKKMAEVKKILLEQQIPASMIENCGMDNERIYRSPEEIPEDAGYYSLIIVKEKS